MESEDKELNQILIQEDNIYTKPVKHYIIYKNNLEEKTNLSKRGFHIYYPILFYTNFLKPYCIEPLPGAFKYCLIFNTVIIIVTKNASFGRLLDKVEDFLIKVFFKLTRLK
jgi:hypothetical protein